jgi:hypothetical protein
LNVQSSRTGEPAGRFIRFLNGKSAGNSLGVLLEGGPLEPQPFIIFVGQFNRTDFFALAAAGAFFDVNVPRLLTDQGLEVARIPLQFNDLAVGKKLYVQMPADLDQFG